MQNGHPATPQSCTHRELQGEASHVKAWLVDLLRGDMYLIFDDLQVVGVMIAMLLVDTVGRRPLLLFGSSITAVAMLIVAAVSVCVPSNEAQNIAASYCAICQP